MQIDEEESEDQESELESDEESGTAPQHFIPEKRRKLPKKKLKIPKFINPMKQPAVISSSKKQKIQDVFDVPRVDPRSQKITLKPLESNKSQESSNIAGDDSQFVVEPTGNAEGFGLILPSKKDEEDSQDKDEKSKDEFITTDELHNNKISEHGMIICLIIKTLLLFLFKMEA